MTFISQKNKRERFRMENLVETYALRCYECIGAFEGDIWHENPFDKYGTSMVFPCHCVALNAIRATLSLGTTYYSPCIFVDFVDFCGIHPNETGWSLWRQTSQDNTRIEFPILYTNAGRIVRLKGTCRTLCIHAASHHYVASYACEEQPMTSATDDIYNIHKKRCHHLLYSISLFSSSYVSGRLVQLETRPSIVQQRRHCRYHRREFSEIFPRYFVPSNGVRMRCSNSEYISRKYLKDDRHSRRFR